MPNCLNALEREENLKILNHEKFDLLIIGGGITGAGVALEAAQRGMKVALIEMQDFAAGTSSRSTKLIHGGLRYLKQLELKLVMETGRERAIAHKNAPHLVHPEKLLLPMIKGGSLGKFTTSLALWVYDVLAGVKGDDKKRMLSKKEILEIQDDLNKDVVIGGGIYAEYRTDDARLCLAVLKTAANKGTVAMNYVKADKFIYSNKKICAVECVDQLNGKKISIKANAFVNAAGPWVDKVREKDDSLNNKQLFLTKGIHLVIDSKKLKLEHACYFELNDGRMIFAIPREEKLYIGTTDTTYEGDIKNPQVNQKDVDYILNGLNHMFPKAEIKTTDIVSTWAGLRPLINEKGKSPSEISRKDEIFESKSGLFTIAGGKLTAYRKMAERTLNYIQKANRLKLKKGNTKNCKLIGAIDNPITIIDKLKEKGINKNWAKYLWQRYGSESIKIINNCKKSDDAALIVSELEYCIKNESTHNLIDFLSQRTSRTLFYPESIDCNIEILAAIAQQLLNWDESKKNIEVHKVREYMKAMITFA